MEYPTKTVHDWLLESGIESDVAQKIANGRGTEGYRAQELKNYVMSLLDLDGAGMQVDLLWYAVNNVDWVELVRVWETK